MENNSKIQFTPKQQKVIDLRGSNILVSAAAGSGKTEVLTQRIVALICDPETNIDIDRMLILTFTKAAAQEMRERIGKEISKRLADNPEDENLWRQSVLLQNAQISTIDSFCLFVIRNNFADISLDPGFRILDEGEAKLMQKEAVREVIDNHFNDTFDEDFRHLVDCYCSPGRETVLEDILEKLYNFVMSDPDYLTWIEEAAENYNIENAEEIITSSLWKRSEKVINAILLDTKCKVEKALALCNDDDGPKPYIQTIADLLDEVEALLSTDSYDKRYMILTNKEITALSRAKGKEEDKDKREKVKKLRDEIKKQLDKLKSDYYPNPDFLVENSKYVYKTTKEILLLLKELITVFAQKKKSANVLSFADMEHYALSILTKVVDGKRVPSQSAIEYSEYFDVIMVDEYQDSNYVQEYILSSISRGNNYFMVGDIKQSIYAFRQATPEIFASKYNTFKDDGKNIRIDLNSNFRSRDEVVDFVNIIFETLMCPATSSIAYDANAALRREATYPENEMCDTEVWLLESNTEEKLEIDNEAHKAEGLMIAGRIKKLFDDGFEVTDKKSHEKRPLKYSDIVILVRSAKDFNTTFMEALQSRGIPAYIDTKTGYFATFEIRTILNYLKILDNPRQDIPLYAVMSSFIGDFSEEEIAVIKADKVDYSLYDAVNEYCKNEKADNTILSKINKLKHMVNAHRKLTTYLGIRNLLEKILEDTNFRLYMQAFCDGEKRAANIDTLLEKATDFENTSFCGLFHFVNYIEELKARNVEYGEAQLLDENADAVRIMTIHGSKGLEFPVCFVSGCGKQINTMDIKNNVIFNREVGMGIDYINPQTREKRVTLQKKLIAAKMEADCISEEIRVLYVALTRAKEKLIITGEGKKIEEIITKLKEKTLFSDMDVLSVNSFSDMILLALAKKNLLDKYINIKYKEEILNDDVRDYFKTQNALNVLTDREYVSDDILCDEILEYMHLDYAHKNLKGLYVKTSVSEMKKAAYEEIEMQSLNTLECTKEDTIEQQSVYSKPAGKGALYGSAMHRIMELVSFGTLTEKPDKNSFIQDTITENVLSGRLDKEWASLININKILDFFNSDIGKRMCMADCKNLLFKEKSFFYGIDADRVKKEFPKEEMMLVQGVIDAYFEEDGELVVVDYKTDKVSDISELVKRYKLQLDLYAEALSSILSKKVKEKIIYSFSLKKEISL